MIRYSQCWEDIDIINKALSFSEDDVVLIVSSGGCNTLSLFSQNIQKVYAVDSNFFQNSLLKLKKLAINNLSYSAALKFIGYRASPNRLETYALLSDDLNFSEKQFWDNNLDFIEIGIANCGKLEEYLRFFRRYVLPLVHSKKTVRKLLLVKSPIEQEEFYNKHWNTFRWKMVFKFFFSQFVMSGRGRSKDMFSENTNKSVGEMYFERTEKALKYGPLHNNFYLNYILLGDENMLLPDYLEEEKFEIIKHSNIESVNADILSFLKNANSHSITKFDLSDIFEPLDIDTTNSIFEEIKRTAKNGARLIFWNNLVERDVPSHLKRFFIRENKLEEELKPGDKMFFYEKFLIYTIQK